MRFELIIYVAVCDVRPVCDGGIHRFCRGKRTTSQTGKGMEGGEGEKSIQGGREGRKTNQFGKEEKKATDHNTNRFVLWATADG